ncbi:MAG: hypothetical protein QM765_41060 [Myxococcales bacterium]
MTRSPLAPALLALLLVGCGGRASPPPRTSPVLGKLTPAIKYGVVDPDAATPTYVNADTAFVDGVHVGYEIRRLVDGHEQTVVSLPDGFYSQEARSLRVVADDDIWVVTQSSCLFFDCLIHWDGSSWEPVSLAGAVLRDADHGLQIEAVAAISGEAWALVTVYLGSESQLCHEENGAWTCEETQLCHRASGAWTCERTGISLGRYEQRLAVAGGTVWVVPSDGHLYRREANGTFVLTSEGVITQLLPLVDGSLAFVGYDDDQAPTTLRRVAGGSITVLAQVVPYAVYGEARIFGRSVDHLFAIATDRETEGHLGSHSVWTQVMVSHVEAGTLREVGHYDAMGGGADLRAIGYLGRTTGMVLPDGRAAIHLNDGVFVTQ